MTDLKNSKPNKKKWKHYTNVGQLKKFIEEHKIPDDALILHQRIEDVYFDKHGWGKVSVFKNDYDCMPMKNEFVVVWSPIKYKKDKNLYLTAHY